jgi:hypothetical protein
MNIAQLDSLSVPESPPAGVGVFKKLLVANRGVCRL